MQQRLCRRQFTLPQPASKRLSTLLKARSRSPRLAHFLTSSIQFGTFLHTKYPNLHVEIVDTDNLVNLAAGDADIGLRFATPTQPDLISRKVFELGWCVFASKEYAVLYGLPKTPEDLRDHRLILYTETRHHLTGFAWMEQFKSDDDKFSRVNTSSVAGRTCRSWHRHPSRL